VLNPQAQDRGFSIIAVTGALVIIGLLMMAALQLVQDHRRRATLSADRALALHEAEVALAAAECAIAVGAGTPHGDDCKATPNAARIPALDPITLASFVPGHCTPGLCWPLPGQTVQSLARLLTDDPQAVMVPAADPDNWRRPSQRARYVIEPIPDALPGQWMQAGTVRAPALFRITAVGFGSDERVNVMLQTVYRPRVTEP